MSETISEISLPNADLKTIKVARTIHIITKEGGEEGQRLQKLLFDQWDEETKECRDRRLVVISPCPDFRASWVKHVLTQSCDVIPDPLEEGYQNTSEKGVIVVTYSKLEPLMMEALTKWTGKHTCLVLHEWPQLEVISSKEGRKLFLNNRGLQVHILSLVSDPIPFPSATKGQIDYSICSSNLLEENKDCAWSLFDIPTRSLFDEYLATLGPTQFLMNDHTNHRTAPLSKIELD